MSAMRGLGRGLDKLIPTDTVEDFFDPTAEEDEKVSKLKERTNGERISERTPRKRNKKNGLIKETHHLHLKGDYEKKR